MGRLGDNLEYITKMVDEAYWLRPDLVPFAGGDRAGMLGQETAQAFAARKWAEQTSHDRSGRPRKTGRNPISARRYIPGSLRERRAAQQARQLSKHSPMSEAV